MTTVEKSILKWHRMDKTAAALSAPSLGMLLGVPVAGSYLAGNAYGKVTAPSEGDLKLLQSKYVTAKLQQAISELEDQKKLQLLKEKFSGKPSTLRI